MIVNLFVKNIESLWGRRSIVDKTSAYGAKQPGFKSWRRQEFININCIFCSFEKINSFEAIELSSIIVY